MLHHSQGSKRKGISNAVRNIGWYTPYTLVQRRRRWIYINGFIPLRVCAKEHKQRKSMNLIIVQCVIVTATIVHIYKLIAIIHQIK